MKAEQTVLRPWAGALRWMAVLATAAGLGACGGGDSAAPGTGTAFLRVALTDAPSCGYDHVYVTVEGVKVHQNASAGDSEAGWVSLAVSPPRRIDLLALNNGLVEELGTISLAPGHYSQLRLVLASNSGTGTSTTANAVQPTGSALAPLDTPSGQQGGLKLQAPFDAGSGRTADLVLDFDACQSVVRGGTSGNYHLRPVLSVVARVNTGIQGYVDTTLNLGSTTIAAQRDGATIRSTVPDSTGKFSIPYLTTGTYTLAVMSDSRATAVVTGIPVGTSTTVVTGTATAIVPPLSTMADVTGTVTLTSLSGGGTTSTAITDATARALQALTGGPTVELGSQPVDGELGTYRFRLPVAATVKAPFVAPGAALSFTADPVMAGKYTMRMEVPTRATQEKPADVSGGGPATVNFSYGP